MKPESEYDPELGYRPCRRERCPIAECHPCHEPPGESEHMTRMREARTHRPWGLKWKTDRESFVNDTLTRLGIEPIRVIRSEANEVLLEEWKCPSCSGAGCRDCRGRGSLQISRGDLITRLAANGII